MKKLISALILCSFFLTAQEKNETIKTLKYRSAIIKGTQQISVFKQALAALNTEKQKLLELKFGKNKNATLAKESEARVAELEKHMLEKYGMYPGVTYIATAEAGTVSLLLTDEQLEKLSGEKPSSSEKEKKEDRSRYPVFKLNNAKAVQNFIADARKGDLIRKRIESLKSQRKEKGVEEQKKIAEQVKKLEEQLVKYDEAMKKAYKIHSNLDYILDTTALSVYMIIRSDDLEMIGKKNEARSIEDFKKAQKK